jgi:hypothetical protein
MLCHCRECHKLTGSAFSVNLMLPKSAYKLAQGAQVTTFRFTQGESGDEFTTLFCPKCGTTVCKSSEAAPLRDVVAVDAGTLDDPETFQRLSKPETEFYTKYRAHWYGGCEGAVQVESAPLRKMASVEKGR